MDGFDPKEPITQEENTETAQTSEATQEQPAAAEQTAPEQPAQPETNTQPEQPVQQDANAQPNYYQNNLEYYRQQPQSQVYQPAQTYPQQGAAQGQPQQGQPQDQQYQQYQPYQQYQQQNPYPPYPQQNPYATGYEQQKKPGKGLGIAALICGIASLVFFCMCINIPLAVAALITGILCLTKKDGAGKGMAIAGIITAAASILFFFIFFGLTCASVGAIQPTEISEIYEDISGDDWNPYDFHHDYDFDYDYDDRVDPTW